MYLMTFLPRDATLAQYLLSLCVRPSLLCLSVASRYFIETTGRIEVGFGMEVSFHPSHTALLGNVGISKNWSTSLWIFVPNSGLSEKFRHGKSIALSTTLVVVVDGRACWRHLYDSRRVVAVYYQSENCNPLTPFLRFAVDSLYNLFL